VRDISCIDFIHAQEMSMQEMTRARDVDVCTRDVDTRDVCAQEMSTSLESSGRNYFLFTNDRGIPFDNFFRNGLVYCIYCRLCARVCVRVFVCVNVCVSV